MINYAHRGASAYAPENTMAAFYLGIEMGANGIETDIRKTADGKLVLSHDSSIKRLTGIGATIEQCSYAQLLELDFGSFKSKKYACERIVLFDDFLKYFSGRGIHLAIEIKGDGIEEDVVNLLCDFHCIDNTIVTSFDISKLLLVQSFDSRLSLGHLCDDITEQHVHMLRSHQIMQICPKAGMITPEKMAIAQQEELSVRAWGVNDEIDMQRMIEYNVYGMTVDFPEKLAKALG